MIYLFVIFLLLGFAVNTDFGDNGDFRAKKGKFVFVFLVLVLIAGLRYMNGGDTLNYYDTFRESPDLKDLSSAFFESSRYQPGFLIFVALCKSIWPNFVFMQLAHAIFINLSIFFFIKHKTQRVFLSLLFYFMLNYLEYNMEIMRESMAVACVLFSLHFYEKKRYLWALVFIALGYEFHISCMIALLYPFLSKVYWTNKSAFIVLSLSIIIPLVYISIPNLNVYILLLTAQDTLAEQYSIQELNQELNINYYILIIFKYVLIPYVLLRIVNKHDDFKYVGFIYAYIFLQLLGIYSYAFYRFANYFAPFYWLLFAEGVYTLLKKGFFRHTPRMAVMILATVAFLYVYQNAQLLKHEGEYLYKRYIPYETVLTSPRSY